MSDNGAKRSVAEGMTRLKELLFDTEVETLGELDRRLKEQALQQRETLRRVEQVYDRAGTEESFRGNVAAVLDKALRDAQSRNHGELARAVAPLVISTIKTEVKNSEPQLVDSMSRNLGVMIKSYIQTEMKRISDSINRQIDRNPVMLRLRSIASGKPMSDLAISYSQRLQVEEVLLIRRGSGELIGHWPDSANAMSNKDIHMAGVLSAINDFAGSAFEDEGGSIQSFRLSGSEVFLRASPAFLLAAKCNGVAPSGIETIFNDEFLATLQRIAVLEESAEARPVLPAQRAKELLPLVEGVGTRSSEIYDALERTSVGGAIVKTVLFLIAVPLLAWFFWGLYTDAEERETRRAALSVINGIAPLQGYQTALEIGYRGKELTVTGLVPDQATAAELTRALGRQLPATKIGARLAVLPAQPPAQRPFDPTDLEQRFEQRVRRAQQELMIDSARRAVLRADQRLRQSGPAFERLQAHIKGAERQAALGVLAADVRKSVARVEALGAAIGAPATERVALEQMVGRVNQTTAALSGLIARLARLHGAEGAAQQGAQGVVPAALSIVGASENLAAEAERLQTLAIALSEAAAMIPEPVAPPPQPVVEVGPEEKLQRFIARHALFFGNGTDFLSDAEAAKTLDQAAALIKAVPHLVRVVGYTDERGDSARNSALAQGRADRVVELLVGRGVPAERLTGVGRAGGYPVSPGAGAGSPNRRAEFELGFRGEVRAPQ